MKIHAFNQFLQAVAAQPALHSQCGAAQDLDQLVQLAQGAWYGVIARELQLWAHDKAFRITGGLGRMGAGRFARLSSVVNPDVCNWQAVIDAHLLESHDRIGLQLSGRCCGSSWEKACSS